MDAFLWPSIVSLGVLGVVFGGGLAYAARQFAIEVDPRVEEKDPVARNTMARVVTVEMACHAHGVDLAAFLSALEERIGLTKHVGRGLIHQTRTDMQSASMELSKEESPMMREKVEQALEAVRPFLQADGGDVKLLDVSDDGVVVVRLTGACAGCPSAGMTLKMGVEEAIKERVPEVNRVEAVM